MDRRALAVAPAALAAVSGAFGVGIAEAGSGSYARAAGARSAWVVHAPALVGRPAARSGSPTSPARASNEGYSVAIAANGRTALIGSYGAGAWVFVRHGSGWIQQGRRLLAPAAAGAASIGAPLRGIRLTAERVEEPGLAVALSGNGSTALIGTGMAAWVFQRHSGHWSRRGVRLFGLGRGEVTGQGTSVALSADGDAALVGAPGGDAQPARPGLAWLFTRVPSGWSQGLRLLAYGAPRGGGYGASVALSANGHTALIGDTPAPPARSGVWVFRKVSKTWLQLARPLRGSDSVGRDAGSGVAISSNGRVALVAASGRSADPTAASGSAAAAPGSLWFFRWEDRRWRQQGPRLSIPGSGAQSVTISSVALARDGSLAVVGGAPGERLPGSLWTFARTGSTWQRQGVAPRIPCTACASYGENGGFPPGPSAAVSGDGFTALIGSVAEQRYRGAAWLLTR